MSASKADDAALYPCRIDDPFLLSLHPTVRRVLAWVFVTLLASMYYLLPATVLVSFALATCGHVTTAAAIGLVLLGGSLLPLHERPYTRRLCQAAFMPRSTGSSSRPPRTSTSRSITSQPLVNHLC